MKDFLLLIVGAFLGYLPILIPLINKKIQNSKRKKREKYLNPSYIYNWILEYYKRKNSLKELFQTEINQQTLILPFLTKDNWNYFQKVGIDIDHDLKYFDDRRKFPVNHSLISKKIKLNQKIFNEPTLYIDQVVENNNTILLEVKKCDYFEMITAIGQLEEETLNAIKRSKFNDLPIRDNLLSSCDSAVRLHKYPFSVGCVILLAFQTKNGFEVLIQRRSSETATYGGYKSVIPSYGLSPMPSNNKGLSLFFYNFIKEFAEELYDYEELIQHMSAKRGDMLWFIDIEEIKDLIDSFAQNSSDLIYTGFGIDVLNATNTLSYLCLIKDEGLISKIKSRIKGSWEVESSNEDLALEFFDIEDSNLIEQIINKNFHFGSAFSILRGVEYLKKLKNNV